MNTIHHKIIDIYLVPGDWDKIPKPKYSAVWHELDSFYDHFVNLSYNNRYL